MGDRKDAYRGWCGNLKERDGLEDLGIDGTIILKCILKKWNWKAWTGFVWLRIGTGGGFHEMRRIW
jgi:hypothetical protein